MFRKVHNVGNLANCFPAKKILLAIEYEIPAKPDAFLQAFFLSLSLSPLDTHILRFKNWFKF